MTFSAIKSFTNVIVQGDSGGPLVATDDDGTVQVIGIVSWGLNCAEKNAPGAYTNVLKYKTFIESVIKPGLCHLDNAGRGRSSTTAGEITDDKTNATKTTTPLKSTTVKYAY